MSNSAPQFGVADGIVTTAVGNSDDHGHSVTIQPDGKLIVAGLSFNGVNSEVALVRYNVDGKLDTTFGGGDGIVTAPIGSLVGSSSVTVQPDGRIVIVGSNGEFAIVRYNADGTLDTSFGGGDGIVTTIIGDSGDHAFSVALQADGRIIVAGTSLRVSAYGSNYDFALVRYNADGTLDTSFGAGDGFVTTPIPSSYTLGPSITSVTVQLDGKIVVAGYGRFGSTEEAEDFAVVRYNADGTLDTSFGDGDGIVTTPIGSWSDESHSVTLQPDGRIIVAGYSRNGASYDIALVRYNVDGTLDTAFGGGDGIVTTPIGSLAFGYSVTLQPDAKIVVAGVTLDGSNADIALIRYDNDGSLDTSFGGGDGIVTTAIGASGDYANSVALQPDGKIVVAGTSLIGDTYDFAVVRYNADGSLDTTFDSVGSVVRAVAYTEDGSAVIVDGGAQVFDAELAAQGHYDGATLTLARAGGANADDVFAATGNLVLSAGDVILSGVTIGTVTNTGGTLAITFNADATQTRVDEAMRWITYANNSDGPPASLDILWTFNDGNTGSQGTGGALETTDTVTVNITGVNDAPNVASPIADQSVAEDTAWSFSVPANTFTDPDSVLTYTASLANDDPLPAWLNFDAGTQTFSGTPPQDFNGVISLKVTASDGTESVSDTFDLTVTPENDPPVAVDDTASGAENAVVSLNVLTNDTDVDTGDSKTLVSLTALTAGDVSGLGALSAGDLALLDSYFSFAGDGTVTLTPGAGLPGGAESLFDRLDPGQQATVSLTYTVEDGSGAQDTGTVVFTISGARELINGTTGDDPSLTGTPYADLVTGLAGNDILSGGAGSDILDGGEGTDTADYSAETSAVNVFLFNVANFGGDIGLASLTAGVTSGIDYLQSNENV
ncbi:MAG: putative Ig domain-containing protein, partial [Hyphomicrobiaceae bacterium]